MGLVLTTMLVPVGAYVEASGDPGAYCVYATIVSLLAYAVFGPSRILVLGSDSSRDFERRDRAAWPTVRTCERRTAVVIRATTTRMHGSLAPDELGQAHACRRTRGANVKYQSSMDCFLQQAQVMGFSAVMPCFRETHC